MTTTMAYLKHVAMAKGSPSNFRTLQVEIGNYMELYGILWIYHCEAAVVEILQTQII